MRSLLIFVPGILTFPGDGRNWSGRAVTFTHLHSASRAEKVEYFCGPIGRAFGQQKRSEKLFRTLDQYRDDWHITLVGHSNGAAVILQTLNQCYCPRIDSLHLVCAACESSFHKNGLNRLLSYPKESPAVKLQHFNAPTCGIREVSVYVGQRDLALRLAHSWAGRLLGYGVLGLHGPRHVLPSVEARVHKIAWPQFGHSDCWHDDHLSDTLENFLPKQTHFSA